jgi:hypothetical protein
MPGSNITMLQIVAKGLGELKTNVVFVGGSVAELYADNPAASDIRTTLDIDCIIKLRSRMAHARLEEKLRTMGFVNDTSMGAPICRWIFHGIKVDIMPTDENILGFSNYWYSEGIENKITKRLSKGTEINVLSPEYYLASKFEAHKNRGGNDLRQSHDFEDIIFIIDNCNDLLEIIKKANHSVRDYLKEECQILLANNNLIEGLESALPYGSGDQRIIMITEIIRNISGIKE